jgi:flagellar L-ring protein precursor FlgH
MKKIIVIIGLFISVSLNAQDLRENTSRSLFSDYKASMLGDAVTIIVVEESQAANQAQKTSGRSSDIGLSAEGAQGTGELIPSTDLSIGSSSDFKGGGTIKSTGVIKTKISALIDSVLSNGLVRIRGSRKISINGEEQLITIKGLVRTADLTSDNTVYSYNISEAEIVFEGNGMIDSNTNPGWLTKVFHWLF